MTGHRPWRELFERTFTPDERARIKADARKMLEEDDQRANMVREEAEVYGSPTEQGADQGFHSGAARADRGDRG
jgi:hypothetical protein